MSGVATGSANNFQNLSADIKIGRTPLKERFVLRPIRNELRTVEALSFRRLNWADSEHAAIFCNGSALSPDPTPITYPEISLAGCRWTSCARSNSSFFSYEAVGRCGQSPGNDRSWPRHRAQTKWLLIHKGWLDLGNATAVRQLIRVT